MINLYQKLGLMPDATEDMIKRAIQQAAEQDRITLDELNKCKIFLLNKENREKYTKKFLDENPYVVHQMLDKMEVLDMTGLEFEENKANKKMVVKIKKSNVNIKPLSTGKIVLNILLLLFCIAVLRSCFIDN